MKMKNFHHVMEAENEKENILQMQLLQILSNFAQF